MKKIFVKIAVLALGAMSLASCRKETDWNLNPAPTSSLDSVKVTKKGVTIKVAPSEELVVDDSSTVRLYYTAKSANTISQITFHDGTWGSGMSFVTVGDSINATPPSTKYRPENKKALNYHVNLPAVQGKTIFSMIVSDPNGMSNSSAITIRSNKIVISK